MRMHKISFYDPRVESAPVFLEEGKVRRIVSLLGYKTNDTPDFFLQVYYGTDVSVFSPEHSTATMVLHGRERGIFLFHFGVGQAARFLQMDGQEFEYLNADGKMIMRGVPDV